ncbi:MAG TPA: AMP-binding protein [Pseudonocardia sp.]|nr:AMP-binding protein [Pseudonocardia sp.]
MTAADFPTLCAAFQHTAAARPDAVALREAGGGVEVTWREYAERVRTLAAGLAALGVGRGATVATMMTNRPEFHLVDTAAIHLGATTYSIYNTSSAEQIAFLVTDADTRVVVCESQFADRIRAAGGPVEHLLVLEDGDLDRLTPAPGFDFDATWHAVEPDDVACLIYTSGTTGAPKGVEHTHRGILALDRAVTAVFDIQPSDRTISYLPASHIADRGLNHYFAMSHGPEVTCLADLKGLPATLRAVRPTVFAAVPRVWEKTKLGIELRLGEASIDDPGVARTVAREAGLGEVRWALSGAAAIPPEVYRFLAALGLPVSEVWGMSECGLGTGAAPADARPGTVGPVLPGYEYRVADDGELLLRGPTLMRGYRGAPEKTAEAIPADGWLRTGDIVSVAEDGHITIVDRKKELIINSGGKNMSPTNIENAISSASPLIGPVMVIGDARPYNTMLITLDPDAVAAWCTERGLEPDPAILAKDEEVRAAVQAGVDAGNAGLSRIEQVKRFTILPGYWEPGGDEVTPTMKLRRKPTAQKYAAEIEALYA